MSRGRDVKVATTIATSWVKGSVPGTPASGVSTPASDPPPYSARDESPPALAWEKTVAKYASDPSLTEEERKVLKLNSLDDFVGDLQKVQLSEVQKSKLARCMNRLKPLYNSLGRFEGALDVVAGADPYGVLSLLWGSMRMVLVVGRDLADMYDDIAGFFEDMGDSIGRLTAYEALFARSKRFNKALCSVFDSLLDFCAWLRRSLRSHKTKMMLKLAFSDSIQKEAKMRIANFKALCIKTESEAQLAGAEAAIKFQNEATEFFNATRHKQEVTEKSKADRTDTKQLRDLHEKLAPIPLDEFLETLQRKRIQGTCLWLLNNPNFVRLLSEETRTNKLTWITGVPGSGKTYISAFLVGKLQQHGPVAYFFCDTKDQAKRTVPNILRTLAWQLLHKANHAVGEVVRILTSVVEITQKILHRIFSLLFREGHAPYILLDGLDECEMQDRVELLEFLQELAGKAHILIVSRNEPDIDRALRQFENRGVRVSRIQISQRDNKSDIQRYIQESVKQLELRDPVLLSRIVEEIGTGAQGMFLYARLMINELDQQDTDEERHEVLMQLPDGIESVYKRSLDKINKIEGKRKARVLRLVSWVVCAPRPITIQELEIALTISPRDSAFQANKVPNVRKLFVDFLTSLLELHVGESGDLNDPTATLTVIHATAKDFLTRRTSKDRLIDLEEAHATAAATCLTYIAFDDVEFVDRSTISLDEIPSGAQFPFVEYLSIPFYAHVENTPFLQYSVANWIYHFSLTRMSSTEEPAVRDCLQSLKKLLSSERNILKWFEVFHFLYVANLETARRACETIDDWILEFESRKRDAGQYPGSPAKTADDSKMEFTFSLNGFRQDTSSQAARNEARGSGNYLSQAQLDLLGDDWSNALSHLGFSGPRGISRWRRATKTEPITRPPFQLAAYFNFTKFLQEELDNGADVETRGPMDRTPLEKSAFGESLEATKLLVENGGDLNHVPVFSDYDGTTPLLHALFTDQFQPLRDRDYHLAIWMLENGAKVENDVSTLNPLHWVFDWWQDNETEIGLLEAIIDRSEDIDRLMEIPSPHHGMSSIHIVARNDLTQSMQLFLQRHSDPKALVNLAWGADSKSPLHEACYHKKSKCGQLLLDAQAEINKACSVSLSTPLHIAANSKSNMLEQLLKRGADIDARDAAGRTALHFASVQDWGEGVLLLLQNGANVNIADFQGQTALELALNIGAVRTPAMLRKAGAESVDVHFTDDSYWPRSSKDVFEVAYLIKIMFRGQASPQLTSRIIDAGEYWLKSKIEGSHPMVSMQPDAGRVYMSSKPITGNAATPVRRIVVEITSQGTKGTEPRHFPGHRSWTWFEIGKAGAEDSVVEPGPTLFFNSLDVEAPQDHSTSVYCNIDLTDELAIWARRLQCNDTVYLLPMARWPNWVNKVHKAKLEIYTSCLRPACAETAYLQDWKSDDWLTNVLR